MTVLEFDGGVHHDASSSCREQVAPGRWRFRLLVPRERRFRRVELFLDQHNNDPWVRMRRRKGRRLDRYEAEVTLPAGLVTYRFRLEEEGGARLFLDRGGLRPYRGGGHSAFRFHTHDEPPAWVREQVFYQIFPDRFRRGEGANATPPLPTVSEDKPPPVARRWGDLPRRARGPREFFGGDLDGVREGLDYLQELGVSALYLNPLFTSPSNHRYDTRDYFEVDPVLGGREAYERLVEELRRRGMRLVLDGVFNHTGDECAWFDPSFQGPRAHWYTPSEGGGYICWWAVPTLPKLDFAADDVQDVIYRGPDSVVRTWLRGPHGADGWRLDVAACLGENGTAEGNVRHLAGIKQAAREANPEAWVMGEHFDPPGYWLDARAVDAVMNYCGFGFPVLEWLTGRDNENHPVPLGARDLWRSWMEQRLGRTDGELECAFNLLGSHDVPRVLTRLGGAPARSRLAHALLFTFPGVPCVYYGDEVGVEGHGDPDCRRCFPWDEEEWARPLQDAVRALAALRHRSEALRRGGIRPLVLDGDLLAYARMAGEEAVVVVANRSGTPRRLKLDLRPLGLTDQRLRDVLGEREHGLRGGRLTLRLPALGAVVLEEVR